MVIKKDIDVFNGKKVEYYSVVLQAFVDNRMQVCKTLITISSGAIGLLITLNSYQTQNAWIFIFFVLSSSLFILTIIMNIMIFRKNSDLIIHDLTDNTEEYLEVNNFLEKTYKWSFRIFISGILFFIVFGLCIAFNNKETNMAKNKTKKTVVEKQEKSIKIDNLQNANDSKKVNVEKSLHDIKILKPKKK